MDTTEVQREIDDEQFEAWLDESAPDHYEPDWEPAGDF